MAHSWTRFDGVMLSYYITLCMQLVSISSVVFVSQCIFSAQEVHDSCIELSDYASPLRHL